MVDKWNSLPWIPYNFHWIGEDLLEISNQKKKMERWSFKFHWNNSIDILSYHSKNKSYLKQQPTTTLSLIGIFYIKKSLIDNDNNWLNIFHNFLTIIDMICCCFLDRMIWFVVIYLFLYIIYYYLNKNDTTLITIS